MHEVSKRFQESSQNLVGLKNQGATCYLNALIQVFYLTPEFRKMIYQFSCPYDVFLQQNNPEKNGTKDIIFQMQLLFAKMQCSRFSVSTSEFTACLNWIGNPASEQKDVQEFNRILCDNLEEKMKDKEGECKS